MTLNCMKMIVLGGCLTAMGAAQNSYRVLEELSDGAGILDCSDDGSTVIVRQVIGSTTLQGRFWTSTGGLQSLPSSGGAPGLSHAFACSADGSVIVGGSGADAVRWTAGTGSVSLGAGSGNALDVSGDGNVIVGVDALGPWRWTPATGVQRLIDPGGAVATLCSADGSATFGAYSPSGTQTHLVRWPATGGIDMVGTTIFPPNVQPFASADGEALAFAGSLAGQGVTYLWTPATGAQMLAAPPGMSFTWSYPAGISADGQVVVGTALLSTGQAHPYRWTVGGGMQILPVLPWSAVTNFKTLGCSEDGTVVYGQAQVPGPDRRPFHWTQSGGTQLLDAPGPWDLWILKSTADGMGLIGLGSEEGGVMELSRFQVGSSGVGSRYGSPAAVNSMGQSGEISLVGSQSIAANNLVLGARDLPSQVFGYFLVGTGSAELQGLPGSHGTLLVAGVLGRLNQAGQIRNSGLAGTFGLPLDLNNLPVGPLASGTTLHFQAWYRDRDPQPTSTFTDGVCVTMF
ncbi:MAG: hypothetical protein P1V35_11120 [Planctomycetota bacterium]|nr:hypothetical protein [Planctomycetota bacterium]